MAPDEPLYTKYHVFESSDEGVTWTRIGEQLARGSEEALRKFFAEPVSDRDGLFVAVSENAFRPRKVAAKVRTSISDFELGAVVPLEPTVEAPAEPETLPV